MVLSDDPVLAERSLPLRFRTRSAPAGESAASGTPGDTLRDAAQSAAGSAEKTLIEKALRDSGGNRTLAARALGVSRKTLFNKIKALGIRG